MCIMQAWSSGRISFLPMHFSDPSSSSSSAAPLSHHHAPPPCPFSMPSSNKLSLNRTPLSKMYGPAASDHQAPATLKLYSLHHWHYYTHYMRTTPLTLLYTLHEDCTTDTIIHITWGLHHWHYYTHYMRTAPLTLLYTLHEDYTTDTIIHITWGLHHWHYYTHYMRTL